MLLLMLSHLWIVTSTFISSLFSVCPLFHKQLRTEVSPVICTCIGTPTSAMFSTNYTSVQLPDAELGESQEKSSLDEKYEHPLIEIKPYDDARKKKFREPDIGVNYNKKEVEVRHGEIFFV